MIISIFCAVFILSAAFTARFSQAAAQETKIELKKVEYTLPYAGMLPDNPLFFLKNMRDALLEFATRDQLKKAQLYLLFADKRIRMAIELAEKDKWQLTTKTVEKAQRYFMKIPPFLTAAKKQGSTPDGDFILNLKLSIEKHREVIESLFKNAPQGERRSLEESLKLNRKSAEVIKPL